MEITLRESSSQNAISYPPPDDIPIRYSLSFVDATAFRGSESRAHHFSSLFSSKGWKRRDFDGTIQGRRSCGV